MPPPDFSCTKIDAHRLGRTETTRDLDKHGLDFADLTPEFFSEALVVTAREGRLRAIGHLGERIVVTIFAPLGREAIAVISMRYGNSKEWKNPP